MTLVHFHEGRILSPFNQTQISGKYDISPAKKKRSTGQNAYLHTILFPQLADGLSKKLNKSVTNDFAKELVKFKFLQVETEAGTVVRGTSKLSTVDCMEFIEKCQQYGAQMLEISIPSPNEQSYSKEK